MSRFVLRELRISIDEFELSKLTNKLDKLILTFNNEYQINKFENIYPELLLKKIYPLTEGIPFCRSKINHCIELFKSDGSGKKKKECGSCKLLPYCNYNSEPFNIKPIINPPLDLIKFLEERDESLNDWI